MIHSESKPSKKLSPAEIQANEELAAKISSHITNFLKIRKNPPDLSDNALLEATLNMAQMCPDLYTIYNFRREILEKNKDSNEEFKQILLKELDFINVLLKKHQKSYALFIHRQWVVMNLRNMEDKINESEIILKELFFCGKMLEKDERNFHVWNYRNWLITLAEDPRFVVKELEFTMQKIEHNFTNFSALHFRAKNLIRTYKEKGGIPIEVVKKELEMLRTGLYMQPDEQVFFF